MTVVAVIAAIDMTDVLARRNDAVVAGTAGAEHLEVIHGVHRRPGVGRMAVLAYLGRSDVIQWLAHGLGSVVA